MPELTRRAMDEVRTALAEVAPDTGERMVGELARARRIACAGAGREGLMIRALCMRLMHLGLDAHMVGEMTTPPIAGGDLLLVSVGPGRLPTMEALLGVARGAGARTMVVTSQPDGPAPHAADVVIHLPAQTMADDLAAEPSALPMGSLFEITELIFFDLVSVLLRERLGQTPEEMRARHTNLE